MASHYQICITGIIQGVGFRPFIYTLACAHGVRGTVYNNSDGVVIDCSCSSLDSFLVAIRKDAPSVAVIAGISVRSLDSSAVYRDFSISSSRQHHSSSISISPDLALCELCQAELATPEDQRFAHPFINCTGCGSRYSIISGTPYDRPMTSMATFAMCDRCKAEYIDPRDRRFHAEPICCPECGPQCTLSLLSDNSASYDLGQCGAFLRAGYIGAIKGIGGYQICCDASHDDSLQKVRRFKNRPDKPFAIMARSLEDIRRLCTVTPKEQELLTSPVRPIVLLSLHCPDLVSPEICRGNSHIGVMLPPSGLHQLVFTYFDRPFLLMTSANRPGEPLIKDAKRLRHDLEPLLDFCIDHDRTITHRLDDSVVMVLGNETQVIRRARGYVPRSTPVPLHVDGLLALGGQQKNCFTMGRGTEAFMGPHIGTLGYLDTNDFLRESINTYKSLFQLDFELVIHDLHPAYDTSKMAPDFGCKTLAVQHHHAHHASCMAENQLSDPCIGIILDGSGYGDDGTIWGGEILVADFTGYKRFYSFDPVLMPSGEGAVRKPLRMALAYLAKFLSEDELHTQYGDQSDFQMICSLIGQNTGPVTSSCGRLFDVVAFILGLVDVVSFEGQAAIRVEQLADKSSSTEVYEDVLAVDISKTLPTLKLVEAIWSDRGHCATASICRKFLNTLTGLLVKAVLQVRQETTLNRVVFSGGTFQNRILSRHCHKRLTQAGFACFRHSNIPCNDGGLALGQLCVGAAQVSRES